MVMVKSHDMATPHFISDEEQKLASKLIRMVAKCRFLNGLLRPSDFMLGGGSKRGEKGCHHRTRPLAQIINLLASQKPAALKKFNSLIGPDVINSAGARALSNLMRLPAKETPINKVLTEAIAVELRTKIQSSSGMLPSHVAMVVWALARSDLKRAKTTQLLSEVLDILLTFDEDIRPINASQIVWGLGKLEYTRANGRQVVNHLTDIAVKRNLSDFNPQHISNIFWGLGALRNTTSAFSTVENETWETTVIGMMDRFQPQALANTCWGMGRLQLYKKKVLQCLARVSADQCEKMKTQELANVLWGLARVGYIQTADVNVDKLLDAAARRLNSFNIQELSNVFWAAAVAGRKRSPTLFPEECDPSYEITMSLYKKHCEVAGTIALMTILEGCAISNYRPVELIHIIQSLGDRVSRIGIEQRSVLLDAAFQIDMPLNCPFIQAMMPGEDSAPEVSRKGKDSWDSFLRYVSAVYKYKGHIEAAISCDVDWLTAAMSDKLPEERSQGTGTIIHPLAEALMQVDVWPIPRRVLQKWIDSAINMCSDEDWLSIMDAMISASVILGPEWLEEQCKAVRVDIDSDDMDNTYSQRVNELSSTIIDMTSSCEENPTPNEQISASTEESHILPLVPMGCEPSLDLLLATPLSDYRSQFDFNVLAPL